MSTRSPTITIMRWTGIARSNAGKRDKGVTEKSRTQKGFLASAKNDALAGGHSPAFTVQNSSSCLRQSGGD